MNNKRAKKLRKAARAIAYANQKPIADIVLIYKRLKTIKAK